MKTNKSYAKRLRVTKNGKVIARPTGQDHFNAKASGSKNQYKKRRVASALVMNRDTRNRFLPKN